MEFHQELCTSTPPSYCTHRHRRVPEQAALQSGNIDSETGVDSAFEVLHEMSGKIRTGQWVGDCFLYTNEASIVLEIS